MYVTVFINSSKRHIFLRNCRSKTLDELSHIGYCLEHQSKIALHKHKISVNNAFSAIDTANISIHDAELPTFKTTPVPFNVAIALYLIVIKEMENYAKQA